MYRYFIRPILFLISPETIHKLIVAAIKSVSLIPGLNKLIGLMFSYNNRALKTEFAGLTFKNPVGLAAGFDKNASFFNQFSAFGFSFIEIGTVTPLPQSGNPKPRSFRLTKDQALINRMGFNSQGADTAVINLKKNKKKIIIGGNIGKNTLTPNDKAVEDYKFCFMKLYDYVDYFVINVSCPNISNLSELQDAKALETILMSLVEIRKSKSTYRPILLKISPDLDFNQIDEILEVYKKTKIDGIVATNTTIKREGLSTEEEKINRIGKGGLSGRPLTKRSTDIIRYISEKSGKSIPIMGVGGILNETDAIEKIDAGATLIQVYTGFIYEGPGIVRRLNKALSKKRLSETI